MVDEPEKTGTTETKPDATTEKPPETQPPEKREETPPEKPLDVLDLLAGDEEPEKEEEEAADEESEKETDEEPEKEEETVSATEVPPDDEDKEIDECLEIAKKAFTQKYGREPDEFNPNDGFKLNRIANRAFEDRSRQRTIQSNWNKATDALTPIITDKKIAAFVDDKINSLSIREGKKLIEAANNGDFSGYVEIVKKFAEEYNANKDKKTKANEKVTDIRTKRESPPPLSSPGSRGKGGTVDSEPDDEGLALFGLEGKQF